MIKVNNVTKKYGDFVALDGINLEIKKGEIVGLLGPNGAGKSTTMKLLTGFMYPDSGSISIDELEVSESNISNRYKIGYMPESNPLYREMLVSEALEFALDIHKIEGEKRLERIKFVIESTSLKDVYNKPIADLSKGFRQRVGLAIALIHDPEILILDEPTEGLDPNQRHEIRDLIKKLGKDRTVIISTHVLFEVEAMCNRVIIINQGKIVLDGDIDEVLKAKNSKILVEFEFTVTKSKEKIIKALQDKFSEVTVKDTSNIITSTINSDNEVELMEQLTKFIRENNEIVLYKLNRQKFSLEDVFANITKV